MCFVLTGSARAGPFLLSALEMHRTPSCPEVVNTSGNPPRDAAKIVHTTVHRVSFGVLRIKLWHLVHCFVSVPSKTLKGFHEVFCR